ncbi:MAG: YdeI/OmpD-associated family protein [Nostocoides sp.]
MTHTLRRDAEVVPMGPAAAFVLTDDEVAELGGGMKAFPVTVTVNGASYALRLSRMGGQNLIGLRKEIREAAGLTMGQVLPIEVVLDEAPREVELPEDFAAALAGDSTARTAYEGMAPSHRKEYVRWITEAKRTQTRTGRIEKALEMLREGRTR